jgi:hypothetical protein
MDNMRQFFGRTFRKRSLSTTTTTKNEEYTNEKVNYYHDSSSAFYDCIRKSEETISLDEDDFNFSTNSSNNNNFFLLKPAVLKSCLKRERTSKKMYRLPIKSSYQVKLPGNKKSQTKSRYISFNEHVNVWMIPSISDLLINHNNEDDELELRSIWFQQDEYDTIQLNLRYLTRAINAGKVGKNVYCTRGLERKLNTSEEGHNDIATRSLVRNLLEEQKKQFRTGYDEQRLYQVCREISRKDIIEATKLGKLDEAISRRILQY